jgi:hypothetical protein
MDEYDRAADHLREELRRLGFIDAEETIGIFLISIERVVRDGTKSRENFTAMMSHLARELVAFPFEE